MYHRENARSSTTSISVIVVFLITFHRRHRFLLSKVLAARKEKLSNARARKNKYTARMLADARKDHSIPLP